MAVDHHHHFSLCQWAHKAVMFSVQCHHFGYFPATPLAFFLSFATVLLRVLFVVVVVAFLMSLSMLLVSETVSFYGAWVLALCPPQTSKLEEL